MINIHFRLSSAVVRLHGLVPLCFVLDTVHGMVSFWFYFLWNSVWKLWATI